MVVACWLAHVFCHGAETRLVPVRRGLRARAKVPRLLLCEARNCGVREARPGNNVVRYSGGSRCLPRLFWAVSKLVYLVVDPAGVFLYPVMIFIDIGWRTRTISDT